MSHGVTPGGNAFRVEGGTARLVLHGGAEVAISIDDLPRVAGMRWCEARRKHTSYAATSIPATVIGKKGSILLMHNWLVGQGLQGLQVDHINRNGLDNRPENLRLVTRGQNGMNRPVQPNNVAGAKGVHWDSAKRKWTAQIIVRGKQYFLGRFNTKEEAASAYDRAAEQGYGEIAWTNSRQGAA